MAKSWLFGRLWRTSTTEEEKTRVAPSSTEEEDGSSPSLVESGSNSSSSPTTTSTTTSTTTTTTSTNNPQHEETTTTDREYPGIPGAVSVTVRMSPTTPQFTWNLDLEKEEKTDNVVIVGILPESSLLHFTFLHVGDILQEVNFCDCRQLSVTEIQQMLDHNGGGFITLSAVRPMGDASMVQATAITYRGYIDALSEEDAVLTTGLQFEQSTTDNSLCVLSSKTIGGYLGQCILEPGDEILWINGIDCFDMTPDDLMLLLDSKFMGADYVCVQVRRKPKWSMRRAAVAAAGGSMVSVGAVIMATPLHPVGHALAVGGVGVLSTEFEGPRRAMQSAKEQFQKISPVGSSTNNNINNQNETEAENDHVENKEESEAENDHDKHKEESDAENDHDKHKEESEAENDHDEHKEESEAENDHDNNQDEGIQLESNIEQDDGAESDNKNQDETVIVAENKRQEEENDNSDNRRQEVDVNIIRMEDETVEATEDDIKPLEDINIDDDENPNELSSSQKPQVQSV